LRKRDVFTRVAGSRLSQIRQRFATPVEVLEKRKTDKTRKHAAAFPGPLSTHSF
jgi:hypothetical protein